jgi:hypothetical protein
LQGNQYLLSLSVIYGQQNTKCTFWYLIIFIAFKMSKDTLCLSNLMSWKPDKVLTYNWKFTKLIQCINTLNVHEDHTHLVSSCDQQFRTMLYSGFTRTRTNSITLQWIVIKFAVIQSTYEVIELVFCWQRRYSVLHTNYFGSAQIIVVITINFLFKHYECIN